MSIRTDVIAPAVIVAALIAGCSRDAGAGERAEQPSLRASPGSREAAEIEGGGRLVGNTSTAASTVATRLRWRDLRKVGRPPRSQEDSWRWSQSRPRGSAR
ncbi:MAG: hypothetical protein ACE5PT_06140 [Gemmatimonadales bacterium]